MLPGLAGSAGQKFTLVLQMEKEKRLGRLGSCPRLQQGQARLPGETTRKPSDTAPFLTLLATEMSSHRKKDLLSAPVAARAMPSTGHRTLALAFMKMGPCENCHTHPRDLAKPTKQTRTWPTEVDGRSVPSGESWIARYCCDFSALDHNYPSLKTERVFRCMMGGPGEALSAKGFQHAFCQSDSGEEFNYWLVLVLWLWLKSSVENPQRS